MPTSDDVAYAIKISPAGISRMCAVAGTVPPPPEWDREVPEPITKRQSQQLTGRARPLTKSSAKRILAQQTAVSLCGLWPQRPLSEQYLKVWGSAKWSHPPDPFDTGEGRHEGC